MSGKATYAAVKGQSADSNSAIRPARWPQSFAARLGNEQAGAKIDECLQIHHGAIICHAEGGKAECQKGRVAGQTHQRRFNGGEARVVAYGMAVDAVGQPVGSNVTVEQRIALDL